VPDAGDRTNGPALVGAVAPVKFPVPPEALGLFCDEKVVSALPIDPGRFTKLAAVTPSASVTDPLISCAWRSP
jgi:hypothetical protein